MTKPALTPEEWEPVRDLVRLPYVYDIIFGVGKTDNEYRHAHAAVALANQSFGFTREDVAELNEWADYAPTQPFGKASDGDRLRSLAARIEALLPPEPVNGNK